MTHTPCCHIQFTRGGLLASEYHKSAYIIPCALHKAAPSLLEALEAAFFALGRAGGNQIDSPYRLEWEKARSVIAEAKGER